MGCCSSHLGPGEQSPRPKVGEVIPHFTLKTPNGAWFDSAKALEQGHLVISFFRGHWCPIDQSQLSKLQKSVDLFRSLGASVVAVCPQNLKYVQKTVDNHNLTFPTVSDPNNLIGKHFGIVHYAAPINSATKPFAEWQAYVDPVTQYDVPGLPMYPYPCTYVVEQHTGRIVAAHVEKADAITRMPIDDIVATLRTLKQQKKNGYATKAAAPMQMTMSPSRPPAADSLLRPFMDDHEDTL